jgi:voltage-gated potassium channel
MSTAVTVSAATSAERGPDRERAAKPFMERQRRHPPGPGVKGDTPWRRELYTVIFEADTPAGRRFDILLIASIIASISVVMLDSVQSIRLVHGRTLYAVEWFFTLLFTIEYLLRLACSPKQAHYARSFFGTVDLLSILPTYISLFFPASKYLVVIRAIRILRVFRVLKLAKYVGESEALMRALWSSRRKITVFLFSVLTLVAIFGSLMYVIEGEENGFTSIPRSVYWAVVTLTTVGYGDISPKTGLGQMIATVVMILGYSIIAVPTGILTAEMMQEQLKLRSRHDCPSCGLRHHEEDAAFCRGCGSALLPRGSKGSRDAGGRERD